MGVRLHLSPLEEGQAVHNACYHYARSGKPLDALSIARWVKEAVPGGRIFALDELRDGEWTPTYNVYFGRFSYALEHIVRRYKEGEPLTVLED